MEIIDKVALLYLNNKKILSFRSKGKDTYYLPGGKREGNENDIETLIREIKEELSVEIVPKTAKLYGIFEAQAHGKADGVVERMTCYTAEFRGALCADNEIEEIRWLTINDMDIISPVDRLIFQKLSEDGLL